MNHYNCRDSHGSLLLVLPGQTRKQLFCPGCAQTYRSTDCLFRKNLPELKQTIDGLSANRRPRLPAGSPRTTITTPAQLIATIKKRWLELGHTPLLRELRPPVNHRTRNYPGGFKRALQVAAAELGLTIAYQCKHCHKDLPNPQTRAQHQRHCKTTEEEGL